jgi:hypothetical protein
MIDPEGPLLLLLRSYIMMVPTQLSRPARRRPPPRQPESSGPGPRPRHDVQVDRPESPSTLPCQLMACAVLFRRWRAPRICGTSAGRRASLPVSFNEAAAAGPAPGRRA